MHQEQRDRARTLLQDSGLQHALFADPATATWLTGFSTPVWSGPGVFAGGPPLVWYDAGHFTLIALDAFAAALETVNEQPNCSVVTYSSYSIEEPIKGATNLSEALQEVVETAGTVGRIGVETRHLPQFLYSSLRDAVPADTDLVAVDGWLAPLRAVKTEEEVAKLRHVFALSDAGHAAARTAVDAGALEIDVWRAAFDAVQATAGVPHPVLLGNDCTVGRRAHAGGPPSDTQIQPNDAFVLDLGLELDGYRGDSCATYYAGTPTQRQQELHAVVSDALDLAISLVKPGAAANAIDTQVRDVIADAGYPVYPHHTGHGIGVSPHEEPRIVPYNDMELRAGMVIMLEPGIYFPDETGIRLEHAVLVTSDGTEVLTRHDVQQ